MYFAYEAREEIFESLHKEHVEFLYILLRKLMQLKLMDRFVNLKERGIQEAII